MEQLYCLPADWTACDKLMNPLVCVQLLALRFAWTVL